MIPDWAGAYIGLPFADHGRTREGCDCWGGVRMVLREVFGVNLPDYADAYTGTGDQASVAAAVESGLHDGWTRVETPQAGDIVILRIAGRPWHCGIMVGLAQFLHWPEGGTSCIERVDRPMWGRRIDGYYRHGSMIVGS